MALIEVARRCPVVVEPDASESLRTARRRRRSVRRVLSRAGADPGGSSRAPCSWWWRLSWRMSFVVLYLLGVRLDARLDPYMSLQAAGRRLPSCRGRASATTARPAATTGAAGGSAAALRSSSRRCRRRSRGGSPRCLASPDVALHRLDRAASLASIALVGVGGEACCGRSAPPGTQQERRQEEEHRRGDQQRQPERRASLSPAAIVARNRGSRSHRRSGRGRRRPGPTIPTCVAFCFASSFASSRFSYTSVRVTIPYRLDPGQHAEHGLSITPIGNAIGRHDEALVGLTPPFADGEPTPLPVPPPCPRGRRLPQPRAAVRDASGFRPAAPPR